MSALVSLIDVALLLMVQPSSLVAESFYDLRALDAAGSVVSLQQFRGQVGVIVYEKNNSFYNYPSVGVIGGECS